jgi:Leucine-rich repeat (LRR) protein
MIGEILSSLEYLKMNDSLIRCFRDIGSSFKFVRVLHLSRCELTEVQGIQAFEHLEELYLSFNDLSDLFDIGFLEHLAVLDLEGNNVSSLDQLYYLRRCQKLQDLTLHSNPVTKELTYFAKLSENLPKSLQYLDQEPLDATFYERKTEEAKKQAFAARATEIST